MENLVFLQSDTATDELKKQMGAKAANLHELLKVGLPVPKGFVLFAPQSNLEKAIHEIGGFPVAVRSSGALEDLPNASFAGLYETILFVNSMEELAKSIDQCFDSKNSHRVRNYLETKNISYTEDSLKMSVLVQKMILSKISGVLFTLNPTNGFEEESYVEFCEGVGERLVSGLVTPSRASLNWLDGQIINLDINNEGTTLEGKILNELVQLGVKIQAHYGKPQDIEWAVDESGKIHILQSRPITTFSPREDRPELTNADLKDGGISARVCTPFMYSAYRNALQFSMGEYLKRINLLSTDEGIQWIYAGYGRAYWNAEAVKSALKKIPGFKEEEFDKDLGIQKDYGEKGPHVTETTFASIVGAIPVLIGLEKEFNECLLMIDQFKESFEKKDAQLKKKISVLEKLSKREFSSWFLEVISFQNETEKKYFRTIYNNSNYQSEFKNYLKKMSLYSEGDELNLMSDLQGVSHLDVQQELYKIYEAFKDFGIESSQYKQARQVFLSTQYHHGPAELDLTVPRWGEREDWVDEMVMSFIPFKGIKKDTFQETQQKLCRDLNFISQKIFLSKLEKSRRFLRLREEMRAFSTRAYYLLRKGILEFAKRFQISEMDAFMLDINEVRDLLNAQRFDIPQIQKRKLFYEGYRFIKAPNEFGGKIIALKSSLNPSGLRGLGCSPGEITGRARVITDIHQTHGLSKNDILVTLFTDPGWTPVLAKVGGVITEVGGLLSHAAVIGREYGIPAILNLIDATKLISDGDLIKVNGKTGEVEILEKSP
jgi:phosphohistidine swiveling domain-containing protein